jgi:hypothetical protein
MADLIPPGISSEIRKYDFSDDIQFKAKEIYSWLDLDCVPRQSKRSKIICFCIRQAYVELYGISPNPCSIAEKIKLDLKYVDSAVSNPPNLKKGFKLRSPTNDPVEYMINYSRSSLHLPEQVLKVMEITFTRVLHKNPQLYQEQLNPLVSAFILFYSEENGISINKNKIAKDFYLNLNTILLRENAMRVALAVAS